MSKKHKSTTCNINPPQECDNGVVKKYRKKPNRHTIINPPKGSVIGMEYTSALLSGRGKKQKNSSN